MLSVITYNIQKGKKLQKIIEWIATSAEIADVMCFQEFPFAELKKFIQTIEKRQAFEYRYAVGFVRGGVKFGQLTLVKKDKLHIEEEHIVSLGRSAIESRVSRDKTERSALLTTISQGNKKFLLANVHLVCFSLNRSRIRQAIKILADIKKINPKGNVPTIMLGDFNYSTLTRQKQLVKIMQDYGFLNAYKKHTHRLFYLKHQIDYVFYKNCFVDRVDVMRLEYSDHFCISFTLEFLPKAHKRVAIFDFDGTIANTIPSTKGIVTMFNRFAGDLGFAQRVTEKDVARFREKSLREIISMLHIRFYKLPFILRRVQKGLKADLEKAKPITGIKEALYQLKKHGYTLGILTSSREDVVEKFLARNNLTCFDVIYTGSGLFGKHKVIQKMLKKNHFSKEEVIYVGDEIRDVEATKKAGIHVIGVTWGFNNKKGLARYAPNFLAEKPHELVEILV
ncbi:MAG: HAD-IA family hydrolase [Patescibacteria group bacterium]|nr:HAD-IA family hydrolase [Patescibacteria group bacterium]MDE2591086.1 HAD-IA family hydrolase [Patescibacteria group bacterium]